MRLEARVKSQGTYDLVREVVCVAKSTLQPGEDSLSHGLHFSGQHFLLLVHQLFELITKEAIERDDN